MIERLTFVYDADGTLTGELRYWFGTLVGAVEHCSLCDITHSRWRKRPDFRQCAERIGIPITYLHRDDLDAAARDSVGPLPAVVGHRGDDTVVLLGPDDLAALGGDVSSFELELRDRLARLD